MPIMMGRGKAHFARKFVSESWREVKPLAKAVEGTKSIDGDSIVCMEMGEVRSGRQRDRYRTRI